MVLLIAKNIPNALRGKLKLWFIEIDAGIFISSVKDSCAKSVIDYLFQFCRDDSKFILVESSNKAPFYKVTNIGFSSNIVNISGLSLKKSK